MKNQDYLAGIHTAISPTGTPNTMLVLRRHGPGFAGLAAVAAPSPVHVVQTYSASPIRLLRLPEVIARVGIKRALIYQRMAEGTFPKNISLGPRAVGWLESEIEAWAAARIAAAPIIRVRKAEP